MLEQEITLTCTCLTQAVRLSTAGLSFCFATRVQDKEAAVISSSARRMRLDDGYSSRRFSSVVSPLETAIFEESL